MLKVISYEKKTQIGNKWIKSKKWSWNKSIKIKNKKIKRKN